ncbi:hypothetical protein [Myxococcus stipitatus]|uniref:hypothetical protein n=1 Tax=Myxococcus stipitatus TaxID=83455 RepID=UPI0030CE81CA
MSGPEFFQTYMGQDFYQVTMPSLVRELARLNDNVERLVAVAERLAGPPPSSSASVSTSPPGDSEGR